MINPGWVLLADPQRGDRMWHQLVSTEHVDDGWHVTASCGREITQELDPGPMAAVPGGGVVCEECAAAATAL